MVYCSTRTAIFHLRTRNQTKYSRYRRRQPGLSSPCNSGRVQLIHHRFIFSVFSERSRIRALTQNNENYIIEIERQFGNSMFREIFPESWENAPCPLSRKFSGKKSAQKTFPARRSEANRSLPENCIVPNPPFIARSMNLWRTAFYQQTRNRLLSAGPASLPAGYAARPADPQQQQAGPAGDGQQFAGAPSISPGAGLWNHTGKPERMRRSAGTTAGNTPRSAQGGRHIPPAGSVAGVESCFFPNSAGTVSASASGLFRALRTVPQHQHQYV